MKALINPLYENVVAEVAETEFEVAEPLFWVDCSDSIEAYRFAYENSKFEPWEPPISAEQNKATAQKLLLNTDWASVPDVSDPTKSNPYLSNVNEFLEFRNQIRPIAINPVAGKINWPKKPEPIWV